MESLAEISHLNKRCSSLEGEVEALKQQAKQCSERQAQLHDVERFFIQMKNAKELLKKEKHSWRPHNVKFQAILQSCDQKTAWY